MVEAIRTMGKALGEVRHDFGEHRLAGNQYPELCYINQSAYTYMEMG